jgi:hypothetical protein
MFQARAKRCHIRHAEFDFDFLEKRGLGHDGYYISGKRNRNGAQSFRDSDPIFASPFRRD